MAAAARAPTSKAPCSYHVFLSFRGVDTRSSFTDHLYLALVNAGFHTFRDDDEIPCGENIESEIQRAIHQSELSVIVFSKDYASSTYCLDELVMIMERGRSAGHFVVPVFYDADPSHVSEQTGTYGEAFARHEQRFKAEREKVERWRAALREISDLRGLVLQDSSGADYYYLLFTSASLMCWQEGQFIQDIVREVRRKLNRALLHVTPHLVGVESVVQKVNLWLQLELDDAKIAIIYGPGGIGKTTIAQTVYNMNYHIFEGASFLENVRESSKQHNGLLDKQRQLLSDICKGKAMEISNLAQGTMEIKNALCCRKILIVLDDVDDADQFEKIIGMQKWLSPASKIIVTTRVVDLLSPHDRDCWKLKIQELEYKESLKLFSWHAFGQAYPKENYREYSERAVKYCGGLPLALKVLGCHLSGRTLEFWDRELLKLEAIPHGKILEKLKISYDSLGNDIDKCLFLDIACFFIGMDMHVAAIILNDIYNAAMTSDYGHVYAIDGIETLVNRCLITVDDHRLGMHDLVRDMARQIIRQESPDNPGRRSRLWNVKDAFTVLSCDLGTDLIRGLNLTVSMSVEGRDSSYKENLKTGALTRMKNLKYLLLSQVELDGGFEDLPKNLIWLRWHGFSLESIPTNFDIRSLVMLDMRNSSLIHAWKGAKRLPRLKILDLSHSHVLVTTPDFTGLIGLERLILKDCVNLEKIHESIGLLESLVFLNLKDCKCLGKLPSQIARLTSLEELVLSGCSSLDELPRELVYMKSLKKLLADGAALTGSEITTHGDEGSRGFLSTTWQWCLTSLNSVWAGKNVNRMPFRFDFLPHTLVELRLSDCNILAEALPRDFSCFPLLKILDLRRNPFDSLAEESFKRLSVLQVLNLSECERLRALPEIPTSLSHLDVKKCFSLQRVANSPNFFTSMAPGVLDCGQLVEVEGIFKLGPVTDADVEMINDVGLFNLGITTESIEVNMLNLLTNTWATKSSLQILHELDTFSIFVPASEVSSSLMLIGPAPAGYYYWVHPVYPPTSSSGTPMPGEVGVPCGNSSLCSGWGLHRPEVSVGAGPDGDAITVPAHTCPPPPSSSDSTPKLVQTGFQFFTFGAVFGADSDVISVWDPENEHQLRPRSFQKGYFQMPCPRLGYRFYGFNLYVRYRLTGYPAPTPDRDVCIGGLVSFSFHRPDAYIRVTIQNITLGIKWVYVPTFVGAPLEGNRDMLWMSHWKFREHQFRTGDKVRVKVESSGTKGTSCAKVKDFGIHLVYKQDDHEKGVQSNHDREGTSLGGLTLSDVHMSRYKDTLEAESGKIEVEYSLAIAFWMEHRFVRLLTRELSRQRTGIDIDLNQELRTKVPVVTSNWMGSDTRTGLRSERIWEGMPLKVRTEYEIKT